MNHSETVFLMPSKEADAQLRFHSGIREMPFAGHPGSVLPMCCGNCGKRKGHLKLETRAGIVPVWAEQDVWSLQSKTPRTAARLTQVRPKWHRCWVSARATSAVATVRQHGVEQLVIQQPSAMA